MEGKRRGGREGEEGETERRERRRGGRDGEEGERERCTVYKEREMGREKEISLSSSYLLSDALPDFGSKLSGHHLNLEVVKIEKSKTQLCNL